jgi:DNA polymerase III gamma/tau subunit
MNIYNDEIRTRILAGSLSMTLRPSRWDEYFNFETEPVFRRLGIRFGSSAFPQIAGFWGPSGSGKTSAARIAGMLSCCEIIDATLRQNSEARNLHPCGVCRGCISVRFSEGRALDGYRELNASSSDFRERFDAAMAIRHYSKWTGSKRLPLVIAIDEAAGIPEAQWKFFHKDVEDTQGVCFIFIMRSVETKSLTQPMLDRMRGDIYEFALPSSEQIALGLLNSCALLGCHLTLDAAQYITRFGGNSMRGAFNCLDHWVHWQ